MRLPDEEKGVGAGRGIALFAHMEQVQSSSGPTDLLKALSKVEGCPNDFDLYKDVGWFFSDG